MGRDRRRLYPLSGVRHPRVPCGRRAAQAQAGEARTEIASDGGCCASPPGAGPVMTRRIYEIVLGEPHPRGLGHITSLAANVAELGLLHPIVIRPDGTPKRAEAVVKLLAEHKAEVLAVLVLGASTSERGDQESAVDDREARRWRDRLATRTGEWFHGHRGLEKARWIGRGDAVYECNESN